MSRFERWNVKPNQGLSLKKFITEQESPAEMARRMGLQSDGSGGYVDPSTGQVVARTVNNELVFYDPQGGAISAQSDGAQLTQAQPSWRDPVTGELTVPPGQAESPEEIRAIPDPIPALAPPGYNAFMNKKKKEMYAQQATPEQEAIDDVQQEVDPQLGMQTEDLEPEQPSFSDMKTKMVDNSKARRVNPNVIPPEQRETTRKQQLVSALERLGNTTQRQRGAGVNRLSQDDAKKFIHYIKNGPQNTRQKLQEGELDYAMDYLKTNHKDRWKNITRSLANKGLPPVGMNTADRGRRVLESYLENMGTSAIDGSDLPYSDSELDHITSLSNGGQDNSDNWAWLPRRFNQFKGAQEDEQLLMNLNKLLDEHPDDTALKDMQIDLTRRQRGDWKQHFEKHGWDNITQGDIMGQKGDLGSQFLKGLAEAGGVSRFKQRPQRESGRPGGTASLSLKELQKALIDQLGIPSTDQLNNFDADIVKVLQDLEDKRSDFASAKIARSKDKKAEKAKAKLKLEDFLARITA